MPLIIFLIFVFVWYFPVYRGQGQTDRLPRRTVPLTILIGMIPVFIVIIAAQVGTSFILRALPLNRMQHFAFEAYIDAALVEEFVKFFAAYLVIRKAEPKRKVDYVLIFGAVGLGYEVTETLLQLDSVIAGIFRGVFALHILWQFWMGLYYWEYRQAKKANDASAARKNLLLAFAVPILIHGTNDFLAFVVGDKSAGLDMEALEGVAEAGTVAPGTAAFVLWLLVLLVFMIFEIFFLFKTSKKARAAAKESQFADGSDEDNPEGAEVI